MQYYDILDLWLKHLWKVGSWVAPNRPRQDPEHRRHHSSFTKGGTVCTFQDCSIGFMAPFIDFKNRRLFTEVKVDESWSQFRQLTLGPTRAGGAVRLRAAFRDSISKTLGWSSSRAVVNYQYPFPGGGSDGSNLNVASADRWCYRVITGHYVCRKNDAVF